MSDTLETRQEPEDHGEIVPRPRTRLSWAWLFPVLAAAATAWLFWSNWKSNGPEIEISFDSAPGIQAGKTPLIYRGVTAGVVTGLRLDRGLDKVILVVRLKAFAADLARQGTVFWIDQPVVGLGKTSGLDALIQGNSLQARIGTGPPATQFVGANDVPLTPLDSPSLVLKLRAPSIPYVDRGSPLFYRGIAVGMVEDKALDEKGNPYLRVVVEKDFGQTVRSNARFWPVPATSLKVGPGGVKLDLLGLKDILLGALQFDVFGPPGDPVKSGAEFALCADETVARATGAPVQIVFRDGQGLRAGQTEVRHLGIPIGYVETAMLDLANHTVDTIVHFQPAYDQLHPLGTVFTLVRPRISLSGISGLETIVSGPYLDCQPGPAGPAADRFEGRTISDEDLLTAQAEEGGVHIVLQAKVLSSVSEGSPVLYRGLAVGKVRAKAIDANGLPYLEVVIRKEYASVVARNARFWQVPGASVQAGPGLLNVDVAGLQSLLLGGIAFDVFGSPDGLVENGAKFELFATQTAARATSPPIRISFDNGQGLLAGETQVRYLGLPVGLVESVGPKDGRIEAVVRLNDGCDFLRRAGSAFSVVRLNVSLTTGVTGLETVVSGVYIEVVPATGGPLVDTFTGVSQVKAAFESKEEHGLEVVVTTEHTNIGLDAPVTYRGLIVGKVARKILADGGRKVGLCVVVDPPYASLLRANTKFWDSGGLKVSLGFIYLKVQSGSLDALARGGLAFATPDDLGPAVTQGHEFDLNPAPQPAWLKWSPTIPPGN